MAPVPGKDRKTSYRTILKNVHDKFIESRCLGMSAELGFWFLYSVFPFAIFLMAISSFLPFTPSPAKILDSLKLALPYSFYRFLAPIIEQILLQSNGWLAAGTLILALWSASAAVFSLISTLNELYEVKETRSWWKNTLLGLVLTIILVLVYVGAFTLLVLGPMISGFIIEHVGLNETVKDFFTLFRFTLVGISMLVAFGLIYAIAPNARWHWRTVVPGAVVAMVGFFVISVAFSFYLQNFAYYNRFYGTLGAVIALMTWFYLIGLTILIGGLVDGEIRHLTVRRQAESTCNPSPAAKDDEACRP